MLAAAVMLMIGCGPQTKREYAEPEQDVQQVADSTSKIEVEEIVDDDDELDEEKKQEKADSIKVAAASVGEDSALLDSYAMAPQGNYAVMPQGGKVVYLTFDDGPSPNTAKVLDILKANGVHATFFVTGSHPQYSYLIRRAYEEGNAIAAHTFTHNYAIYSSMATYFDDLEKIQQVIEKQTGHRTPIIRFPGGSSNGVFRKYNSDPQFMVKLTQAVRDKGYQYVDWNLSNGDATGGRVPVGTLIKNGCVAKSSNVCLLMHDTFGKETTVQALPTIIRYFKNNGYEFGVITSPSYTCHHSLKDRSGKTLKERQQTVDSMGKNSKDSLARKKEAKPQTVVPAETVPTEPMTPEAPVETPVSEDAE